MIRGDSTPVTADVFRATSLLVITLAGRQVAEITRFDAGVLQQFGSPESCRAEALLEDLHHGGGKRLR